MAWQAPGGSSGPTFLAKRITTNQTINGGATTKIEFNGEEFDTDNCFDSTTNYRFTPNKAGYYQLNAAVSGNGANLNILRLYFFKNGTYYFAGNDSARNTDGYIGVVGAVIAYANGTSDYFEIYCEALGGNATITYGVAQSFSGIWIRS